MCVAVAGRHTAQGGPDRATYRRALRRTSAELSKRKSKVGYRILTSNFTYSCETGGWRVVQGRGSTSWSYLILLWLGFAGSSGKAYFAYPILGECGSPTFTHDSSDRPTVILRSRVLSLDSKSGGVAQSSCRSGCFTCSPNGRRATCVIIVNRAAPT